MNNISNVNSLLNTSTADLLKQKDAVANATNDSSDSFASHLKDAIGEMNEIQVEKEEAVADLATGQVKDLHQAALAIGKAELNMKFMLEVRNKALSAYKELGRTQL